MPFRGQRCRQSRRNEQRITALPEQLRVENIGYSQSNCLLPDIRPYMKQTANIFLKERKNRKKSRFTLPTSGLSQIIKISFCRLRRRHSPTVVFCLIRRQAPPSPGNPRTPLLASRYSGNPFPIGEGSSDTLLQRVPPKEALRCFALRAFLCAPRPNFNPPSKRISPPGNPFPGNPRTPLLASRYSENPFPIGKAPRTPINKGCRLNMALRCFALRASLCASRQVFNPPSRRISPNTKCSISPRSDFTA